MAMSGQPRQEQAQQRLLGGYQLLQTLVGIRLRSVSDPDCRRHLTWISDITAALELVSRRMSGDGAIDFAAYLDDVCAFWSKVAEDRGIGLQVRGQEAVLPDSHVLPLALITHELISNAVRHAFPEGRRGAIAIAFSQAVGGVSLVVRDSGVGAEQLVFGEGLALVQGLVDHLGGAMHVETRLEAGVGVRIRLPLDARKTQ